MPRYEQLIAADLPAAEQAVAEMATPVQSTGHSRELYLDLAERIVRTAAPWQREDGLIIDPTTGDEPCTTTARFVGALGLLTGAGRCADLLPVCERSMTLCCRGMATGDFAGKPIVAAEFFTKELIYAYRGLRGKSDPTLHEKWRRDLAAYHAADVYASIRDGATHNFPIYAVAGEVLRQREGLADTSELVDEVLHSQRANFTELGMYRDPHDPFTYDLTVRHQLALMLWAGYRGRHVPWMDAATRKGGLATLLYQSSTGQAPFGGRSNQFHIQEGMISGICEMQASRWTASGNHALAGAFKRAARRAAAMTARWILDTEPFLQTKSGFAPELRHGIDSGGEYSCYGLLAASLFATAWHVADESIAERLSPAESGGFAFTLWPAFHKVFATCAGYHIEIDARADLQKDATGLGRFHRAGAPPELALSAPIAADPAYTLSTPKPGMHLAIGPAWRDRNEDWHTLAEMSDTISDVQVDIRREDSTEVAFDVIYTGDMAGVTSIRESYRLSADGLRYAVALEPAPPDLRLRVPLLESDGATTSQIGVEPEGFEVAYLGCTYRAHAPGGRARLLPGEAIANRNGLYRIGEIAGVTAVELNIDIADA